MRQDRVSGNIREAGQLLAHASNNNKDMDDNELFDFLDREINFNQFTKGLDLAYFSKY